MTNLEDNASNSEGFTNFAWGT